MSTQAVEVLNQGAVELILRGHPWDQGNCPLNGGWAGVC